MVDFLGHAPLFEGLEPRLLDWLAHQATVQTFAPDDELFKQQSIADDLYLLVDGRVGMSYCDDGGRRCVFLRALEGIGESIGWSALVDPRRYRTSAFAIDLTHVVALPSNALEKLCEQEPALGVQIMRRILQAIGSRLRFTRVRMVAQRYGAQIQAMLTILDQAAESLPISSPLHKIPYLLENRLTLSDAFHTLELTRAHGDPTERNLAELSLEVLQGIHRELKFYQGLQSAYEAVANAPPDLSPEQVRTRSMKAFLALFEGLSWRTAGEDLLPDKPGNIVIMNHLENHMDTMLPNEFRLTLDSHFVSSVILFRRYGEAPVRDVRKPEMGWFGYQQYFDRLDYLYVYPGDVDEEDHDCRDRVPTISAFRAHRRSQQQARTAAFRQSTTTRLSGLRAAGDRARTRLTAVLGSGRDRLERANNLTHRSTRMFGMAREKTATISVHCQLT